MTTTTDRTPPARPVREHIDNTQALKDSGLNVLHINKVGVPGERSLTVAYERINSSHLKISTAVCHSNDTFSRKVGTKIALANFAKGSTIVVPASRELSPTIQLRAMFDQDYLY